MKTITLMVMIDGNEVVRNYEYKSNLENAEVWGNRVIDILDTLESSKEVKEF